MPYFKPSPVADESALKRFGSRRQTVVRRCTRAVRGIGGLLDTVFDRDYASKPPWERNGYVFYQADHTGMESAMWRAIRLWYDYPAEFRALMVNDMRCDHSWSDPAGLHQGLRIHPLQALIAQAKE